MIKEQFFRIDGDKYYASIIDSIFGVWVDEGILHASHNIWRQLDKSTFTDTIELWMRSGIDMEIEDFIHKTCPSRPE